MGWKKNKLVEMGWGSLGLTDFAFSLAPAMMENGVRILDAMMAAWGTQQGIRIGYNNADEPDGEVDSGIPDHANEAVYLSLAQRLGSTIGKVLLPVDAIRQRAAYDALLSFCQSRNIPEMQYRRDTPVGAGNKPYQDGWSGMFFQPVEQLTTNPDGFLDGDDGTPFVT